MGDTRDGKDEPSGSRSKRAPKTKTTQKGSTLTINASGNAKVEGNSMTGSVINMTTNNYAAGKKRKVRGKRSGTKRKSNDSSPGPSTSQEKKKVRPDDSDDTKVTDDVIESLAEDIGINNKFDKLGLALGFKFPAIKIYKAKNHPNGDVTYAGTQDMLIDWREGKAQGSPASLKEALIKAKLAMLAEKYFEDV